MSPLWACAALAQAAPIETGVDLFLFDEQGAPVVASVRVAGLTLSTDARGALSLSLPPGSYTLMVAVPGQPERSLAVEVGPSTRSELLLTLQPPDALGAELEAADPALAPSSEDPRAPLVELSGRVLDEAAAPVVGARVFVRGSPARAETGADGRFQLLLPAGEATLSVVKSGFSTASTTLVVAPDGPQAELRLVPAAHSLTYEVVAPKIEGGGAAMLEERRQSSQVTDVLGAEEMSRAGDSSAASALKRVTGLTLVGGKYIYVRGLGERYSSTLLNGASLPSPEPERRVVPLDLFPTGMLDSVVVHKTFSPDMPAEFGGGTVALRTRSIPDELLAEIGVSGGWVAGTTMSQGLSTPGGSRDWLGTDDGTRALPEIVQEASDESALAEGDMFSLSGYTAEELEQFGEAMPNRWSLGSRTLPPNFGANASLGHGFEIPGVLKAGGLVGGSYDQSWDSESYDRKYFLLGVDGALEEGHSYRFDRTTRELMLGGIATGGVELFKHHRLTWTELHVRSTDDEARIYQGFNRDVDGDIRVARSRWLQRELRYRQLRGEHSVVPLHLPGASPVDISWHAAWTRANRYEPDRREWREDYEASIDSWLLSDRPEGNQIVYSQLSELGQDLGLNVGLPFPVPPLEAEGRLQVGVNRTRKDRGVDTRRYKYMHKGPLSNADEVLTLDADEIFVPDNIGADGFQFEEITRQTDNYLAEQRVDALYLLAELPVTRSTRLNGGARREQASQRVETFELFNPDQTPVVAELQTSDWLPAAGLTQQLPHEMQIRAGYGRTLSRPDFRELSPATFNDVTGGRQTYGNPELQRALIDNADLRWEWFFGPGEVLGLGAFAKWFHDPIEQIVIVSAQHSVTYENADGATDLGVELDGKVFLDFLLDDRAFLAGNIALIQSRVDLGDSGGIESSKERALQGQSPYVVNLQLGWEDVERGSRAMLVYNVSGKRITDVGALGAPDSYELAVHQVDLIASQEIVGGLKVGLKLQNLLDWPLKQTQGEQVVEEVKLGREASLKLSWAF